MKIEELEALSQSLAETNRNLVTKVTSIEEELSQTRAELESYKKHGTLQQIEESMTRMTTLENSNEEITESLNASQMSLSKLVPEGTESPLDFISESLASGAALKSSVDEFIETHGTFENVSESMDRANNVITDVNEVLGKLGTTVQGLREFHENYGTIETATKAINRSTEVLEGIQSKRVADKLAEVAESYGKTPEEATAIMTKYNLKTTEELEEMYESLGILPLDYEDIQESVAPGHAFKSAIDGASFRRGLPTAEEIAESRQKRQKRGDSNGDTGNSPDRFARLVG